jgi:hypothetical protein
MVLSDANEIPPPIVTALLNVFEPTNVWEADRVAMVALAHPFKVVKVGT